MDQWSIAILFMNLVAEIILNKLKFQEDMALPNIKAVLMLKQLNLLFKVSNCMAEL